MCAVGAGKSPNAECAMSTRSSAGSSQQHGVDSGSQAHWIPISARKECSDVKLVSLC